VKLLEGATLLCTCSYREAGLHVHVKMALSAGKQLRPQQESSFYSTIVKEARQNPCTYLCCHDDGELAEETRVVADQGFR